MSHICPKCNREFSVYGYKRHIAFCTGPEYRARTYRYGGEIDEKLKQPNGFYQCPVCQKEFSKRGIASHIFLSHSPDKQEVLSVMNRKGKYYPAWNKGRTAESDIRIAKSTAKMAKTLTGRVGTPISQEHKDRLSTLMKEKHRLGTAHNIGKSRWNNKPSYPEEFFMEVIKNEFEDKTYEREVSFHRFSLDFVWEHKKKVIEIDGEQHLQDLQAARDKEKDLLLKEEGYKLLRIWWVDICRDSKKWIQIAKDFIHSKDA